MTAPEILTDQSGGIGIITLNRPKAVNALSYTMIGLLDEALTQFEHDDTVHAVVVRGAGDRGLCSGGDVVSLHEYAATNNLAAAAPFFRDEYTLDHRISEYPKPYVVVMNGLVLGGGVGIAAPGSHRVATDTTRIGMPEVGIGFSPDVGGVYFLANAPGRLGRYLALTGTHVTGADAVHLGMADVLVPDDQLEALVARLSTITEAAQVDAILAEFHTEQQAPLAAESAWIDQAFAHDTVEEIVAAVERVAVEGHEEAQKTLKALRRNAPLGMKVSLEAINRAQDLTLAETLVQDLRTTMHAVAGTELAEGIRAQLIDKDRNPQWSPIRLEDVTDAQVHSFFEPVDGIDDLELR